MVWFLYPNKNASPKSVQDVFDSSFTKPEGHKLVLCATLAESLFSLAFCRMSPQTYF